MSQLMMTGAGKQASAAAGITAPTLVRQATAGTFGGAGSDTATLSAITTTGESFILCVIPTTTGATALSMTATLSSSGSMTFDRRTDASGSYRHFWFHYIGAVTNETIDVVMNATPTSDEFTYFIVETPYTSLTYDTETSETSSGTSRTPTISPDAGSQVVINSLIVNTNGGVLDSYGDYTELFSAVSAQTDRDFAAGYIEGTPSSDVTFTVSSQNYHHDVSWT